MAGADSPYSVAAAVLAQVQAGLSECQRPVETAMVAVGGIVVDDCCAGLLVVAIERIFRARSPFPTEAGADEQCETATIALELNVYLARCVPTLDDRLNAPSAAVQEAAFAQVLADAAVVWQVATGTALLGDDGTGDPLWERANVGQTFVGPEGGCVGVETRFTLGVGQYGWCVDCPPLPTPASTPPGDGFPGEGGIHIVTGAATGPLGDLIGAV
jgi:hypothetical protein